MLNNTIIYIIGYAGTGKYTIAKALYAKHEDIKLVDNHLINNPIFSLINADGKTKLAPEVWENTDRVREVVFDTMINISPEHYSFVLTNCLFAPNPETGSEGDQDIYDGVYAVAKARNANFIPVFLRVDVEEMVKRRTSPGRAERFKDTYAENVYRDLAERKLLDIKHPNRLDLDVTHLSAEDAAMAILDFIHKKP